uniref:Conotoxin n=1 Tax=Conus betulinus TaxID=89764 RepID=A0A142C1M0_CONBE|nr:conotoxin [Conus betulinus]
MKLTCAVIVAVLFLTASQLIATDDSRGKQKYLIKRSRAKMQNHKLFKLTKRCDPPGTRCSRFDHECCDACMLRQHPQHPICSDR